MAFKLSKSVCFILVLCSLHFCNAIECSGQCDTTSCDFMENCCLNRIDTYAGSFSLPDVACQANGWGILFEIFVFLYAMLGLAVVCDDHMVVALERMCDVYKIREDVAGATFMAFGSAAPEIIVNMVGTIKQAGTYPPSEEDLDATNLGVGAILGSGMIAFLVIPAACALFSADGVQLLLKRRPLLRDVSAYSISLLMLCIFMHDGIIAFYEALCMVCFYILYVIIVIWAPSIRRKYRHRILKRPVKPIVSFVHKKEKKEESTPSPLHQATSASAAETGLHANAHTNTAHSHKEGEEEEDVFTDCDINEVDVLISHEDSAGELGQSLLPKEEHGLYIEEDQGIWKRIKKAISRFVKFISQPLCFLFEHTCPNCEAGSPHENWFPVTFIVAFLWVSFFSNVISACVVRWTNFTPSWAQGSFFGLLTIAVGAEIPDTIQSVTMAKRGYGSMAVSNAIGSQVINIAIGLGLPWLIATASEKNGEVFQITDHDQIQVAAYFQLGAVTINFLLLLGLAVYRKENKALLTRTKGYILITCYVIIVAAYIIVMLNGKGKDTGCEDGQPIISN